MNVIINLLTKFFDPLKNNIVSELIRGVEGKRGVSTLLRNNWRVAGSDCCRPLQSGKEV